MNRFRLNRNFAPAPKPKLDPRCQEATPESLRIEIDQIFKEFLDDPCQSEYVFPPDLNNLQRKYIHAKAQEMNIISKSYGKEPDRRLHLKKKNAQVDCCSFIIEPGAATLNYFIEFASHTNVAPVYTPSHRRVKRSDKVIGRLVNGVPTVPAETYLTQSIINIRESLPIYDQKDLIVETIRSNQVAIISSETGSGKTTQVPQYIMEDMHQRNVPCKIICTQPRRISTISAAERVAYERGDALGNSVGYHIKLEQKYGLGTNLIYCTTGVLLRNLMLGCEALMNVTHIIIDEVHERDKLSDFLLICLRQCLPHFPNLKVILMSATMNAEKFLSYFGQGEVLSVPGRLYPINVKFLDQVLYLTKYMTAKMRDHAQREVQRSLEHVAEHVAAAVLQETNAELDEALEEYLNFSDKYDYRVHYEEATVQLVTYFLSEGLSVDYQHSKNGRTALMIAAFLGDKEFITRLCNMGANMDLCCKLGKTAFDYAHDQPEILHLLEYIRSKRNTGDASCDAVERYSEHLRALYDKTTSDDYIDFDLIVALIAFIERCGEPGAILIFLPGYDDIMMCNDKISNSCSLQRGTYQTFFLHSSMNIREQHQVFKHLPGKRKIILSTNIAETSITIDDVVFVIDTGKAKEKCYDSYNKVSSLQTRWISQACAKQRTGRAGRTRPGVCFRMFSKQRYENMDVERVPEILRVSLEELCLHTKVIAPEGVNIHDFLTMAPDAPSANSIKVAVENLQYLGALDKEEELTPLGEYLAQLAIEPHLGKMLIYAVVFRCLEPVLTLAASMTHKDPFLLPPQANLKTKAWEKRKELLKNILSDHMLYLMAFQRWQEETQKNNATDFCQQYFISNVTMNSILETRGQLLGQLRAAGFVHQSNSIDKYNTHANSWGLVKAIICTGLYPNIAYPVNQGGGQTFATRYEKKVNVQNNSACANRFISSWLLYDEKIKHRNCLLLRGVTAVSTITVSLIGGVECVEANRNTILLDDWLEFEFPGNCVLMFRRCLETLVKRVIANPSYLYSESDDKLVSSFRSILDLEDLVVEVSKPPKIGDKPLFFFPQTHVVGRRNRNQRNPLRGGFVNSVNYARYTYASKNGEDNESRYATSEDGELSSSLSRLNLDDSSSSPSERLLSGLGSSSTNSDDETMVSFNSNSDDKFGNHKDEKIFVLVKPKAKRSVQIAQHTNKWVFAPQTEKKIMFYVAKGRTVVLLFTVGQSRAFQGMAEFVKFFRGPSGKPTGILGWVHKFELEFSKVRQLRNPYNGNRPIYEGLDGQIIQQTVAEELVRIYGEVRHLIRRPIGFQRTSQGCSNSGIGFV